jgi:hypothetical protein
VSCPSISRASGCSVNGCVVARDARVRIGPVAHEIAQAPDRVDALLGGRGEHGLESVAVSVDVREKGGAHLQQWCECTVDG